MSEPSAFDASELAIVLSHYDVGVIESVTQLGRGSRRSPKVGLVTDRGKYFLKRRAPHRSDTDRVLFSHLLLDHLLRGNVPVARLVPVRDRSRRYVDFRESVYELFEFVPGHAFARTAEEAGSAGGVLAKFHNALDDFHPPESLKYPRGDFHDVPGVRTGLCSIGSSLHSHDSLAGNEAELAAIIQALLGTYEEAATAVNQLGFDHWLKRFIHADWHPGNLLFRQQQVVAVVDLDTARLSRSVVDVANGAMQFSIKASGDPETWPAELDEERYHRFLHAYESARPINREERRAIPPLMAEALIAECVQPIAQTGSMGQWSGFRVLRMARRKLEWILANRNRLEA